MLHDAAIFEVGDSDLILQVPSLQDVLLDFLELALKRIFVYINDMLGGFKLARREAFG